MSSSVIFGIKNCDTVRKARKWLEAENQPFSFHDFREQGIDAKTITQWTELTDWELLFNKRSTSFRALTDAQKDGIDKQKAISLMVEHPTLIKRPVLIQNNKILIGFKAADYQAWFN
ncbi:arsenate reductase [Pseudomonadota bacterium]|uniref:arsenate reductase n=1 Tax=unclassified Shewanella TaxID=196818 RepID=UPI000C8641C0|nr:MULTISPECIES: arsenate reductase [unclassified Shewanella]MDO6619271.1 arsenate reductase [Shewanella sp. 6_MG-2023]MDO6640809.1 arsenate reductase [Shewanella sp. 5_MG-2023]MDO6678931.1 arsenate reductase [Shewanella sp. 4_MG-2023]MDO6776122.1 arsenate reductase [Shewanella sp. 3_MG-2023]PMH87681.1 arsenate reductase [Shewanella sp. 10N.286.48.B5]